MSWTTEYDELLCREVLQYEPYAKKPSQEKGGKLGAILQRHLIHCHKPNHV